KRARTAHQQLAIVVLPFRMATRSNHKAVLLPSFLYGTTRSELAEFASTKSHVRRHALLVHARRRRIPDRRCLSIVRRSGFARRPDCARAKRLRRSKHLAQVYRQPAGGT